MNRRSLSIQQFVICHIPCTNIVVFLQITSSSPSPTNHSNGGSARGNSNNYGMPSNNNNNYNASPAMSSRTGGAGGSGGRYKPSPRPGSLGATGPLLSNRGGSLPVVGGYGQTQGVNSGRNSGRAKTAALPGNENDGKR